MEDLDCDDGENEAHDEDRGEPPVRDLGVIAHQLHVDVVGLGPCVQNSSIYPRPVVESGVNDKSGRESEGEHECHAVRGRQVYRRILSVSCYVELNIGSDDIENVEFITEAVSGLNNVDGKVRGLPNLSQ